MKTLNAIFLIITIGFLTMGSAYAYKPVNSKDAKKSAATIKSLTSGCVAGSAMTELDLNNVRALILNGGDMWWDLSDARYEIPKGSGKMALYAGAIWVGGVDVNGQLRVCAQTHRGSGGLGGNDFWPGPLVASGAQIATVTPDVCIMYDRHYKINKLDVERFAAWYSADAETKARDFTGYSVPEIITNWPAHGPETDEYDFYLAPFYDNNGDGFYDPTYGDYPYYDIDGSKPCNTIPERRAENLDNSTATLFGDQTLWWVYNDKGNIHTATTGAAPIGMEFRAQAFAFSTNDELNDMTFYNYQIINRSTYTLADTYFGIWTDADMGLAWDDYVGCDVNKGLGYLYNGDNQDGDGNGATYGNQPPAIGVDFFEGPYQDPDNFDNASSWIDADGNKLLEPLCDTNITNGNINGLNFGDGVIDNERWGMRRFLYFNNDGGNQGNPGSALDIYNYLKGVWRDGKRMVYGGDGYSGDGPESDFMFPNETDPCGWGTGGLPQDPWTEELEQNTPYDRRFVQSAGPFVLEPGAVNDITIGAVWARAGSGGAYASVDEVRRADNKAQKLFENCFQVLDGPDSPEMDIVELDRKFIFHLWNRSSSNNYLEGYQEEDPFIECPTDMPDCDKYYVFQGYQVYQLSGPDVSISDLYDLDLARLIYQCDIEDDVTKIVNYEWSDELEANIPVLEVDGENVGISHTFEIDYDAFAAGDRRLINHRDYYYIAIAYAHNDYLHYDQNDENSIAGQKTAYKAGRKGAAGAIPVVEAIPHPNSLVNGGTIINAEYGDGPIIQQVEGFGNGNNSVELSEETIDYIMSGGEIIDGEMSWRSYNLTYERGLGPIDIRVIDPLNVPNAEFTFLLEPDSIHTEAGYYVSSSGENATNAGLIRDTKWTLIMNDGTTTDTVKSDNWIRVRDEKLVQKWGMSVTLAQVDYPGQRFGKFDELEPLNNGFIEASIEFEDNANPWLFFINDGEGASPQNFIRAGNSTDEENITVNDYVGRDDEQIYETVLGGTWAPYALTSTQTYGTAFDRSQPASIEFNKYRLSSIMFVITDDQTKWTRCPVVEMCENDRDATGAYIQPTFNSLSEGNALRFQLRKHASMAKDGTYATAGSGASTNENDANFIGETGMSWFPGYAIDLMTGERLNLMFGEDTRLVGENGRDMIWNPSFRWYDNLYQTTGGQFGQPLFSGKHYIYVIGHNEVTSNENTAYDYGKWAYDKLITDNNGEVANVYKHAMWVALPSVVPDFLYTSYADMPETDVTIKIKIANPYHKGVGKYEVAEPINNNYPAYKFNTDTIAASSNELQFAEDELDKINVVPNPYYGYSEYERSQIDNVVKFTNLPEKCVISVYNTAGTLIRKFDKDSEQTFLDWDLKNTYGISISGGVYIIHVDAYEYGEKVLKWFGSTRPIDLTSF
jgi:hypothetical protein